MDTSQIDSAFKYVGGGGDTLQIYSTFKYVLGGDTENVSLGKSLAVWRS